MATVMVWSTSEPTSKNLFLGVSHVEAMRVVDGKAVEPVFRFGGLHFRRVLDKGNVMPSGHQTDLHKPSKLVEQHLQHCLRRLFRQLRKKQNVVWYLHHWLWHCWHRHGHGGRRNHGRLGNHRRGWPFGSRFWLFRKGLLFARYIGSVALCNDIRICFCKIQFQWLSVKGKSLHRVDGVFGTFQLVKHNKRLPPPPQRAHRRNLYNLSKLLEDGGECFLEFLFFDALVEIVHVHGVVGWVLGLLRHCWCCIHGSRSPHGRYAWHPRHHAPRWWHWRSSRHHRRHTPRRCHGRPSCHHRRHARASHAHRRSHWRPGGWASRWASRWSRRRARGRTWRRP
eukprot:m.206458 g.206458  ORF g.206458 m.206458 type:complete len:338 (+) comp18501_c0_seq1:866-1879(+)